LRNVGQVQGTQSKRQIHNTQKSVYVFEICDSTASGQGIHSVFLARYWLRSRGEQPASG